MSRFGNRLPRNFDVDAYMTKLHGSSKRGPIGKAQWTDNVEPVSLVRPTPSKPHKPKVVCPHCGKEI